MYRLGLCRRDSDYNLFQPLCVYSAEDWVSLGQKKNGLWRVFVSTLCCREMMWKRTQQQWVEEEKVGKGKM